MQSKSPSLGSGSSIFFQLHPRFFKVEHSFAKTMKPNTTYRLVVYKGVQRCDQMKEAIKGKLIGGKIVFEDISMNFHLPTYSPTRNIEFTVKVFQSKMNAEQTEIANHKIKSSDYVKLMKADQRHHYRQEATLVDSFLLIFDLFVHHNKLELESIVKDFNQKQKQNGRSLLKNEHSSNKKGITSQKYSQNRDSSAGGSRQSRRLSRKRGHEGLLNSRSQSRQQSLNSSRNSSRKFVSSPRTKRDEHFMHPQKKLQPPKVDEHPDNQKGNRIQRRPPTAFSSPQNLKPESRQQKQYSNNKKSVEKKPPVSRQRYQAAQVSPQAKNNVVENQKGNIKGGNRQKNKGQVVTNLQYKSTDKIFDVVRKNEKMGGIIQTPKQKTGIATKEKVQQKKQVSYQTQQKPPISPKDKQVAAKNLEYKNTGEVFDIVRKDESKQMKEKQAYKMIPPIQKTTSQAPATKIVQQSKRSHQRQDTQTQKKNNAPVHRKVEYLIKATESNHENIPQEGEEIKFNNNMVGNVSDDLSNNVPTIGIQTPQFVNMLGSNQQKRKRRLSESISESMVIPEQEVKQEFQNVKNKIFYVVFSIVSILLFYNALFPTPKV